MSAAVLFLNSFDEGADEGNLTAANSASSGDALASVVINGASVGSAGITQLTYETAAAVHGDTGIHFDVTGSTANGNYLQCTIPAGTGDYIYAEMCFIFTGGPTALIRFGPEFRAGTNDEALIQWGTDGRFVAVNDAGAQIAASKAPAMTAGHQYGLQLAMKPGTGTGDGYIGLRLWDYTDGVAVWTWSAANVNAGTVAPDSIRFRLPLSGNGITAIDIDTIRIGRSASADDWLAPHTVLAPPNITNAVYGPFYLLVSTDAAAVTQSWSVLEDTTTTGKVPVSTIGGVTLPSEDDIKAWFIDADEDAADWIVTATDALDRDDTATADTAAVAGNSANIVRRYRRVGGAWV